jgi:uncharacterized Ntn-hydrolase superfamily protein
MNGLASTFSIVGRSEDGLLGVAVSSRVIAVGANCPFVRPKAIAIACQAYLHPYLALEVIDRLERGVVLEVAAGEVLDVDPGRDWRQFLAIGPAGSPFAYTGRETDPWSGHRLGSNCAAGGNLLMSEDTITAMVDAFEAGGHLTLPERLLHALSSGQSAGGDRRGRQSAALLVAASQVVPFINLRVDDHPDPVAELGRIFNLFDADGLARARWMATTRDSRALEDIKSRQREVRSQLANKEGA